MKNLLTATLLGYLVSTSTAYLADGQPITNCRYSDGYVLTIPGYSYSCPYND